MPPTKRASVRNNVVGPYDRPEAKKPAESNRHQDSPVREGNGSKQGGLLNTPGRILSGVFSWLSPWKSRTNEDISDDASDPDKHDVEGQEADGIRDSELRAGSRSLLSDPSLLSFAAELDAKFPASSQPGSGLKAVDSSKKSGYVSDFQKVQQDLPSCIQPSQRRDLDVSTESSFDRGHGFGFERSIHRPRAIPKMNMLAVACLVSRMGTANREKKRKLITRFSNRSGRTFTVLPEPPVPASEDPSAFRVVVPRPVQNPSPVRPLTDYSSRSGVSAASRGSLLGHRAVSDNVSAYQERRMDYSTGISLQDSLLGHSMGISMEALNSSTRSRRSDSLDDSLLARDRSLSAKEFSERALSTLSSALQPLGNGPHVSSIVRASKDRDHSSPIDSGIPPSCPSSARAGEKRVRESFAPEPLSARKMDFESRERPVQRRRIGPSAAGYGRVPNAGTLTVRRILNIIKDTSVQPLPSASDSVDSPWSSAEAVVAPPWPEVAQIDRRMPSRALAVSDDAFLVPGQKRFEFSAPDDLGLGNMSDNQSTSSFARSTLQFTFSEPEPLGISRASQIISTESSGPAKGAAPRLSEPSNFGLPPNTGGGTQPKPVGFGAAESSSSASKSGDSGEDPLKVKAREREEQKRQLAQKAGVPAKFQWPEKKVDVSLEPSGNKELDEEDGFQKPAAPPAGATAASTNGKGGNLPSLADMFKPKEGEWRCAVCMSLNPAKAALKCMSCEALKPGTSGPSASTSTTGPTPAFKFGVDPPASSGAAPAVFTFSSAPSTSSTGGFIFGAAPTSNGSVGFKVDAAPNAASDFKIGAAFGTSKVMASTEVAGNPSGLESKSSFTIGSGVSSASSQFSFGNTSNPSMSGTSFIFGGATSNGASGGIAVSQATTPSTGLASTTPSAEKSSDPEGSKKDQNLSAHEKRKAVEREEQKKAIAAKMGVPTKFQWPSKREEVGLESSGNREIDEEDQRESATGTAAAAAPVTANKAFTFGSTGVPPVFGAGASGPTFTFGATTPSFSFGNSTASAGFSFTQSASKNSGPAFDEASSTTKPVLFGGSTTNANASSSSSSAFVFTSGPAPTVPSTAFSTNASISTTSGATSTMSSASKSTTSSVPVFSFGAVSGTASSSAVSASAAPVFTFGASTSGACATASATVTAPAFTFGASSAASSAASSSSAVFTFGASSGAAPAAGAPVFMFGASSSGTTAAPSFGAAQVKPQEPSAASFVFGAPKAPLAAAPSTSAPFVFGAGSASTAAVVAPASVSGDGMMADDDSAAPAAAAAPSQPFSFAASSTGGFGAGSSSAFGLSGFASSGAQAPSSFNFGGASQPPAGGGFSFATPSATPSFGSDFGGPRAPSFGATGSSASTFQFGAASAPTFGSSTATFQFGAASAPNFGASSSAPAFGASATFGAGSAPSFGTSAAFSFGTGSAPPFGASGAGTPAFGAAAFGAGGFGSTGTSTSSFGAGPPAFGSATPAFGAVTPFGAAAPAFGAAAPAFGAAAPAFGAAAPAFGASAAAPAFGMGAVPAFGSGASGAAGSDVPQRKMVKAKRSSSGGAGRGR